MKFTEQEWRELRAKQPAPVVDLEREARARKAAKLIGAEEWDWFTVHLTQILQARKQELEAVQSRFTNPKAVLTAEEVMGLRHEALVLQTQIGTLEQVLALPYQIANRDKEEDGLD